MKGAIESHIRVRVIMMYTAAVITKTCMKYWKTKPVGWIKMDGHMDGGIIWMIDFMDDWTLWMIGLYGYVNFVV